MLLIVYVLHVVNTIHICISVCNALFHWLIKTCSKYNLENLALRKPTWENNPWPHNENFKTANAVDGKYTDRTAGGGQCTISDDGKHTAEWRVDLGSVVSIRRIDIYYRIERIST